MPSELRGKLPLLLFDGYCVLCNRSVHWLAGRARPALLHFAPLQGQTAARLREACYPIPEDLRGVVLVEPCGRVLVGGPAVLRTMAYLRWPWRALAVLAALPPGPVQFVYDWIARNRYQWFGQTRQQCELLPPQLRRQILA